MRYRWLGGTGVRVSELALGTNTFGSGMGSISGVDESGARDIVHAALDEGVNFFDTADVYSDGTAERYLGSALRGKRDDVVIATKGGAPAGEGVNESGSSRAHIMRRLEKSLANLGTDYVDLYYLHFYDPFAEAGEVAATLESVLASGKARFAAVSNYPAWELVRLRETSQKHRFPLPVAYQGLWNLLAREAEDEIVPACRHYGLGFISWAPLAGGLLTGKYVSQGPRPEGARYSDAKSPEAKFLGIEQERVDNLVGVIDDIARAHGASVAQVALAWQLSRSWLTSAIIGARKTEQLTDNLRASNVTLDVDDVRRLDEAAPRRRAWPFWHLEQVVADRTGG